MSTIPNVRLAGVLFWRSPWHWPLAVRRMRIPTLSLWSRLESRSRRGRATTVSLVADPPPQTLAVWAIEVAFDPDVVSTMSRGCDSLDTLSDSQTVTVCEVVDVDENGQDDTVKVVGAMIFNDTGFGLSDSVVLADITFNVVSEPGPLHRSVSPRAVPRRLGRRGV